MLAVGLVQQVVDARTELEVLVQPVGAVDRQHAEAGALVEVLADHRALVLCDPTLRGDHAPEATGAPVVSLVGQAQTSFQWRDLRHGTIVAAVLAPGIGQARITLPVAGETVAGAHLGSSDGSVDVADLGAKHAGHYAGHIAEQNVILDQAGIGGNPGLQRPLGVLQADVQLRGLLRPHRVEGLQRAHRAGIGNEQLPIVGEAFGMAEAGIPGRGQADELLLIAQEAAVERVATRFTGSRVVPVAGNDGHARSIMTAEELALVGRFVQVQAQAADELLALAELPGQLAEDAVAVQHRVRHPGQCVASRSGDHLVGGAGRVHDLAVLATLSIDPGLELDIRPLPGADQPATQRTPVDP